MWKANVHSITVHGLAHEDIVVVVVGEDLLDTGGGVGLELIDGLLGGTLLGELGERRETRGGLSAQGAQGRSLRAREVGARRPIFREVRELVQHRCGRRGRAGRACVKGREEVG